MSSAYYALFHELARSCADLLIGGPGAKRSRPAWNQVYRALEHGTAKNACLNGTVMPAFPRSIRNFADLFVQMQIKRHAADYDPDAKPYKSAVLGDIAAVETVLAGFRAAPVKHRQAFAALVLFKIRP
ncbi:MAG: hypothetical protein KIS96_13620 [Bauldia sp.]|nr:hypothetical protein [Bauldia sp.]